VHQLAGQDRDEQPHLMVAERAWPGLACGRGSTTSNRTWSRSTGTPRGR
jgi:hypothetical protein